MKPVVLKASVGLVFHAGLALASGSHVGNGGGGMVCRDNTGTILMAEPLDLYEGKSILKLSISDRDEPVEDQIQSAGVRLRNAAGELVSQIVHDNLEYVRANIQPIASDEALSLTGDVVTSVRREGCSPEQIINFRPDGRILIDSLIDSEMKLTGQAAIRVHEAVYKMYRDYGFDHDAERAKKLTAYLFADSEDLEMIRSLVPNPAKKRSCKYFMAELFIETSGGVVPTLFVDSSGNEKIESRERVPFSYEGNGRYAARGKIQGDPEGRKYSFRIFGDNGFGYRLEMSCDGRTVRHGDWTYVDGDSDRAVGGLTWGAVQSGK